MKTLNNYISEALIKKDTKISIYNYYPKDKDELRSLIEQLLVERGKDANLNDIDVSAVINMSNLFYKLDPYNIDISKWDVSNVKKMYGMFDGCKNFNCDLSKWNVSKVEDMFRMFWNATSFNCDLSHWNVSKVKVKNMKWMFYGCTSLKNKPSWYKK